MKAIFKINFTFYDKHIHIILKNETTYRIGFFLYPDHLIYPYYHEAYETYKRRLKLKYIF